MPERGVAVRKILLGGRAYAREHSTRPVNQGGCGERHSRRQDQFHGLGASGTRRPGNVTPSVRSATREVRQHVDRIPLNHWCRRRHPARQESSDHFLPRARPHVDPDPGPPELGRRFWRSRRNPRAGAARPRDRARRRAGEDRSRAPRAPPAGWPGSRGPDRWCGRDPPGPAPGESPARARARERRRVHPHLPHLDREARHADDPASRGPLNEECVLRRDPLAGC